MNLAHLHLLLNHFPIIGTIVGLGLFVTSLVGKNDDLKRAGLIVFACMALLSLPTFFSGIGAQGAIQELAGVSDVLIDQARRRGHSGPLFHGTHGCALADRAVAISQIFKTSALERNSRPASFADNRGPHGPSRNDGRRRSSPGNLGKFQPAR